MNVVVLHVSAKRVSGSLDLFAPLICFAIECCLHSAWPFDQPADSTNVGSDVTGPSPWILVDRAAFDDMSMGNHLRLSCSPLAKSSNDIVV